jgi:[ribosomal protein S5]-alanine N-acetyltransferase
MAFGFEDFPVLTTSRLVLREIRAADAADVMAFRGDPEVERWNTRASNAFQQVDAARDWIAEQKKIYSEQNGICWGITLHGQDRVIGSIDCGYSRLERIGGIGYLLARAYWSQGIITEAARAVIIFAFERLCLHRLNVNTRADNLGSMRLLEKLSLPLEGVIRECALGEDGCYQSWAWFGLLEQEYPRWKEKQKEVKSNE